MRDNRLNQSEEIEVNLMDWLSFFEPYELALQELKINLRGIRQQYKTKGLHSPIEFVDGRIKTISSILDKLDRMGLSIQEIDKVYDIAGIRINCQFVEDIYMVVELLKKRQDLEIVETRDYILHQRASGYRSYHIHAYYHLETIDGMKKVMVEFQIRTLAMNFWASIEHSLNYKYEGQIPEGIKDRLKQAAEAAGTLRLPPGADGHRGQRHQRLRRGHGGGPGLPLSGRKGQGSGAFCLQHRQHPADP